LRDGGDPAAASSLERILSQQLDAMSKLMSEQIALLKGAPTGKREEEDAPGKVNFRALKLQEDSDLTGRQKDFLEGFIRRFATKTRKSKEMAQRFRPVLADWINTLGFRYSLKEIAYPLVSDRSSGARFRDIDGNEYIDIAMGKGVHYFGHSPAFINEAISGQMEEGFELSPQSKMAGEVAELISELTGVERVTFCNTGSEAVMVALRIARTVTGKKKIALFSGAYHGISDAVLATGEDGHTYPTAPGIMQGMVDDVIVLNYGTQAALDRIGAEAEGLAAVLVECVQSRRPGFQPREFLSRLRQITSDCGALLIFDEIITGFRTHPGGVQSLFGVRADIVTYGKVVGGGMPISVVAGKAEFMQAIDGGMWQYGDDSYPAEEMTMFGGTYCRHPLALAATRAVLLHMKERGPSLQDEVNDRTARMASELNAFFESENVPVRMVHFGSLFRFESYGEYNLMLQPIEMDLLFYLLMDKGVYTWERRICFLSTAHTADDVDFIVRTFKESIKELREGGFSFEGPGPASPLTCPMTSTQQRMYVLSSMEGGERGYHLTGAFMVVGDLDPGKVEDSFRELVRRHESLRTGFEIRGNDLLSRIYPEVAFNIDVSEETEECIADIIARLIKPFDLSRPPLLRVSVVKFSPSRNLLFIDAHHIAADGLSMNIIISEFTSLYEGRALPPVMKNYRDFQAYEAAYLDSKEFGEHEAYWLSAFSGELPVMNLPTDFRRPAVQDFEGRNLHFVIDEDLTGKLKLLARNAGTSVFMILLSAYYALLYKLTGQRDLTVGLPVGGRPGGDFEGTVGMFANTLALRNILSPEMRFSELAGEVKKKLLTAHDYAGYPFGRLIEKLNMPKDVSRNPLFDTMFIFENADSRIFRIRDLVFTPCNVDPGTSMFDLTLEAIEAGARLLMRFEYSTRLFTGETIARYRTYFENLLREILLDRDVPLSEIRILPETERRELLLEFDDAGATFEDRTVIDLFEDRVALSPDRTAVIFGDRRLTFGELNDAADRIAYYLREIHSVRTGDLVGIMMARSENMVAGMLGIMKSGAAYVPIDPAYPEERISYMLENSRCAVVLTEQRHVHSACLAGNREVGIADIAVAKGTPGPKPQRDLSGQCLAYVMYTSGSTGKPKGVMIEHRNVVSFSGNLPHVFGFSPSDIMLGLTTYTFDISVLELICSLLNGLTVVVASEEVSMDPEALLELIRMEGVSVMQATPSRMNMLVRAEGRGSLGGIRVALVGGERFPEDLYADLKDCGIKDVFNVYGPTETTIWSTAQRLHGGSPSVIGRPLLEEGVIILGADNSLMPVGCAGEICIYGRGVGRGYLDMRDLTAEKFVGDPEMVGRVFSGSFATGRRFYRTGDMGRRLQDGSIEFFGRRDHQVKVRGFRVELGAGPGVDIVVDPVEECGELRRNPSGLDP